MIEKIYVNKKQHPIWIFQFNAKYSLMQKNLLTSNFINLPSASAKIARENIDVDL